MSVGEATEVCLLDYVQRRPLLIFVIGAILGAMAGQESEATNLYLHEFV